MQTGVFIQTHLGRWVPGVLYLYLFIHLCQAAPGLPGTQREESVGAHPPSLANPFGSAEDDRRLLQSYIQSSLKDGEGPEISTWEQEVFFLFRLHDYDRSGLLDGLEMMKLISDYNSHHTPGANELVVSMVDFLLHTQDLNQDGLLAPSELLSPSLTHTQDSSKNPEAQQEEVEEKVGNNGAEEEKAGASEQKKDLHDELQPQDEEQQEIKTKEDELINQVLDEQHRQQIPEAPAAEHGQDQQAPVHQGQPEI